MILACDQDHGRLRIFLTFSLQTLFRFAHRLTRLNRS